MIVRMPKTEPGGARCPICGKPAVAAARPFCSARCADVDLGRWLTGQYRIPGPSAELGRRPAVDCRRGPGRGLIARRASCMASRPQPRLRCAQVAQLVEHATENRSVGGSIPPLGTILTPGYISIFWVF